jgi:endo-1,4-beta-xylanase
MPSLRQLLSFLPAVAVLAQAAAVVQPAQPKSVAFYEQINALIVNSTQEESNVAARDIEKRAGTLFSNSKDGVDAAGYYYSLYNDNGASATYTEYNSGQFAVGWTTKSEFLAGKGYRGTAPK